MNHKLSEIRSNFQIANNIWDNANSLLKESVEKLIWAIEKGMIMGVKIKVELVSLLVGGTSGKVMLLLRM
ncbi:hypothetical protein [Borreliella americana]|uniref:hypothetical protein n=1 Tax=Borreliella americana TaxID=478807 RepID=UPI001E496C61|nr:hypothetical protein [Borreliella americana]MCD2332641.1 hypothetical protein [Borreliella americana]